MQLNAKATMRAPSPTRQSSLISPPVTLITSRLGLHSLAESPSLPLPARYKAPTASLALYLSLLISHTLSETALF